VVLSTKKRPCHNDLGPFQAVVARAEKWLHDRFGRVVPQMIKYVANFLATKITLINEMADLSERLVPTFRRWRAALASTIVTHLDK
jgi:hypothetical protein